MSEGQAGKFGALATIVGKSLDDIPDLPVFKTPPPGVYIWIIESCKEKKINEKTAIVAEYVIVDTVELNNPEEYEDAEKMQPGEKFSEAFWFDDPEKIDTTLGVLKLKFGGLGPHFGTTNLLEILDKMEGLQVKGIVGNRVDRKDATKVYPSTKDIVVHTA